MGLSQLLSKVPRTTGCVKLQTGAAGRFRRCCDNARAGLAPDYNNVSCSLAPAAPKALAVSGTLVGSAGSSTQASMPVKSDSM